MPAEIAMLSMKAYDDLAEARRSTTRASYVEAIQGLYTGRDGTRPAQAWARPRRGNPGTAEVDSGATCALSSHGAPQRAQPQKPAQEVPSTSKIEVRRRLKGKQQV